MSERGLAATETSTLDVSVAASVTLGLTEHLDLTDQEIRIADALRRCIGRWGMSKTTIDDIAREAGVSRATVYRQFPGGKSVILSAAVTADVQRLLTLLSGELAALDDLESCLVAALHRSAVFLDEHPALRYMREHESAELEQILGFERTDAALVTCGEAMVPMLSRFLPAEKAFDAGMWGARILISYLAEDPLHVDLLNPDDTRRVIRTFMIPGLLADGINADLNPKFSNPSPEIQTES